MGEMDQHGRADNRQGSSGSCRRTCTSYARQSETAYPPCIQPRGGSRIQDVSSESDLAVFAAFTECAAPYPLSRLGYEPCPFGIGPLAQARRTSTQADSP